MIVHESPLDTVEIPDVALTEYVLRGARHDGTTPALIDGPTGHALSFDGFADRVQRLAGGLADRGFAKGSTLALMAPNTPDFAVVFHAVGVAGGTVTTVNPSYHAEEVAFQLADAGASMLVTSASAVDIARVAMETTAVDTLVVIDEPVPDGAIALDDLLAEPLEQQSVDVAQDVLVLPYSSGTTGLPKGVMLTHRNLVANLCQIEPVLSYAPGEVALAVLPFFHIYGMQVLMNGVLAQGATVLTMPRFDLVGALELMQAHRVSRLFAVPPMVLALAKQPVVDQYDLSSLEMIFSGAAPLGADLAEEAAERIGCPVVQGYGMTELSPVTHATLVDDIKPGSSGVTIPNVSCRLVDPDTGEDQPPGGEGELWVQGPNVMKGYLNNPDATAETIDGDGWLHTGDIARIDPDGHCTIVDRLKELIKVKGFQVPPAELEGLIVTHPAVADTAVVGVDDAEAGELVKAFVVTKPGSELSADELRAFVAEHVATYKQVKLVEFVDEIPKSASGKILRRMLRS